MDTHHPNYPHPTLAQLATEDDLASIAADADRLTQILKLLDEIENCGTWEIERAVGGAVAELETRRSVAVNGV
jgi:hypothetical protein